MAATYTIGSSAKFLTSALNPIRKSSSSQQDKMFRGLPKMKINTSYPPQIEATRHRVVSYRCFCQSVHFSREEGIKSLKTLKVGWACVTPVTRITSSAGARHLWGDNKMFATKTTETDTPKGGSVKESGGGLGRLDAAHEHGFFHKINKSKLEEMKERIRKRTAEQKKESKKPDLFSETENLSVKLETRSGSS